MLNFIVVTGVLRYVHYFKLSKAAKYIGVSTNFLTTSDFRMAMIELVFALIHPNVLLEGKNKDN